MEEKRTITVEEALKVTIDNLKKISIPVEMIDSIGIPIAQSINNLNECVRAIIESKEKEKQEAEETFDLGEIGEEPKDEETPQEC